MQEIYKKVYAKTPLTQAESVQFFTAVMGGEVDDITLSSILTALHIRGETADEIAGAVSGLLQHARPFPRPNVKIGEIVGTGGDGHNTINISSASAIIGAAVGLTICKHGNRKITSKSGSADALSELGFALDASPETSRAVLDKVGVCFLMAPNYHPSVKYAMPVRQTLRCRTIFNILGPLLNPARPDYIVNGVFDKSLLQVVAHAHIELGVKRGVVVYGNGLDEVTLHGTTDCVEFFPDGSITSYTVSPEDFGLPAVVLNDLVGGTPEHNAQVIRNIANGTASDAHTDIVCANVAMLLRAGDVVQDLKQGVARAKSAIADGAVTDILNRIKSI